MVKNEPVRFIAKGQVMEINISLHLGQGQGMGRICNRGRCMHDFLEAVETSHAPLVHLCQNGQAEHGTHEDIHIQKESDEIRKLKFPLRNHPAAGQDNDDINEIGEEIDTS